MTGSMLVRAGAGWEQLTPQTTLPEGGITDVFGDDVGAVLGAPAPMTVVAASPVLSTGKPDAIVLDVQGNISIVSLNLGKEGDRALPDLLSFAGALHGMSFAEFTALCNRVTGSGGLSAYVKAANKHTEFHKGTFEVTLADALAQGRFGLVAIVSSASAALTQSLRYLNASGATAALYEAALFSSASVMAVNVTPVEIGHRHRTLELRMSSAGMVALTEQTLGAKAAKLMAALQLSTAAVFDDIGYDGDARHGEMRCGCTVGEHTVDVLKAGSDGSVTLNFESLAPVDANWTVRAELAQAMSRLLGADLGDVKKISQLNLDIREHLMDTTLIDAFAEILGDAVSALRSEGEGAAAPDGAVAAAA